MSPASRRCARACRPTAHPSRKAHALACARNNYARSLALDVAELTGALLLVLLSSPMSWH